MQIVKPDLPSSVVRFVGETAQRVLPSFNATLAVPFVHDWGPLGSEADGGKLATSLAEWERLYGTGDTGGRDAVVGAFLGSGLPGAGGAGGVIPYRMGTGAVRASKAISNAAAAPALTLTAKWAGTRGNLISYSVGDDPAVAANDLLVIRFNGAPVERYSYPQADITFLANLIAAQSAWVTPSGVTTGTALAVSAGTALAAGANGAAGANDYDDATRALEFAEFGIFAPANVTDVGIKAQLLSWVRTMADEMRPVRAIFGGAAGESVADAITDAALMRDEHVIRFGVGTYHDDLLDKDLSTAELAPRLGGVLAARGEKSALTRALLAGLSVVGGTGPSTDELKAARDGGVSVLRRVSNPDAELAVSQGVTTFTDRAAPAKPYEFFSEPRIVGLLDRIVRQLSQWGDDKIVGDVTVTDDTRYEVRKEIKKLLDGLESTGLAQPGTGFVNVDPPNDPALEDAIPYEFGFKPTRTANYLIGNGRIR